MTEEYTDEQQTSIWNFDGAELFLLFQIKSQIVYAMDDWDLEEAYRKIRLLRMELDAKLVRTHKKIIEELGSEKQKKARTEKAIVDEMMQRVDNEYAVFININNPTDEQKANFYKEVESFYMYLCYLMKSHGLYFREGEDTRFAVLRR